MHQIRLHMPGQPGGGKSGSKNAEDLIFSGVEEHVLSLSNPLKLFGKKTLFLVAFFFSPSQGSQISKGSLAFSGPLQGSVQKDVAQDEENSEAPEPFPRMLDDFWGLPGDNAPWRKCKQAELNKPKDDLFWGVCLELKAAPWLLFCFEFWPCGLSTRIFFSNKIIFANGSFVWWLYNGTAWAQLLRAAALGSPIVSEFYYQKAKQMIEAGAKRAKRAKGARALLTNATKRQFVFCFKKKSFARKIFKEFPKGRSKVELEGNY